MGTARSAATFLPVDRGSSSMMPIFHMVFCSNPSAIVTRLNSSGKHITSFGPCIFGLTM